MNGTIVVGVDGSRASVDALRWALSTAAERECAVEVVTAWPHTGPVFLREVPGHHSDARERARTAQDDAVRTALSTSRQHVPVTTVLENARPHEALAQHATGRRMLVVGATSGALAEQCRARIDCTVTVVDDAGHTRVLEPLLAPASR